MLAGLPADGRDKAVEVVTDDDGKFEVPAVADGSLSFDTTEDGRGLRKRRSRCDRQAVLILFRHDRVCPGGAHD